MGGGYKGIYKWKKKSLSWTLKVSVLDAFYLMYT